MTKSQDPPKPEFLYSRQKLRSVITPRRLSLNLERLGRKWVSTCPFHQPAEKSLYFFDSLGYWEFKCTQCGMGGDLIDYISHIHFPHLDADQARDASIVHWVQLLSNSEKATLSEVTETTTGLQSGVNERSKVLDAFVQYCAYALENNANAREWLASHGWTLEQSRLFGLGHFDGEIDPFLDYCALHGLDQSLVFFYLDQLDSQRNPCMTFPARNSKGQIYTVYGMDLIPVGARSPVEYWPLSSVNGDVPFNISPGIDHPIVVPELWDVMAAELQGISGVVSLLGRPLTPGHLHKLKAGGSESLTLILEQGEGRSRRPVQDLEQDLQLATSLGLSFKSVLLPKGYTVASYLHHHGVEEFNQLLQSTAPDTSRTRRRASLMQEIGSCYEENMSREPGSGRGWSLEQFPQLSRRLHGIRPGYHLILSNAFFDKAFFLTALGLDLVESNPCKMIYITLETYRKQVFNRMVSCLSGIPLVEDASRQKEEADNQRLLEATKTLLGLVKASRLEIWDDNQVSDDRTLLALLRDEAQESPNFFVCIDGFYRIPSKTHSSIVDAEERRSAAMLDIAKILEVPVFCGGEAPLVSSQPTLSLADLQISSAYLRDSHTVLCLCSTSDGGIELHLLKNRLGGSPWHVRLETDSSGTSLRETE